VVDLSRLKQIIHIWVQFINSSFCYSVVSRFGDGICRFRSVAILSWGTHQTCMILLESGTPELHDTEADRGGDSVGGCIAHSTIVGWSITSDAGRAPVRSGAHT
jgi:hypothetical protein